MMDFALFMLSILFVPSEGTAPVSQPTNDPQPYGGVLD